MKDETRENLQAAFAGESQAHVRSVVYADRAEREGRPNVARLFRATSYSEQIHAANHLRGLREVGDTAKNLAMALAGETDEIAEIYPAYIQVAVEQEESGAQRSMENAFEAKKVHAALYRQAGEAVAAGKDVALGAVHVCDVCGFTMEGEAPDRCPVCGAPRTRFRTF